MKCPERHIHKDIKYRLVEWGLERGGKDVIANVCGVPFTVMKMFCNYIVVVVAQLCDYAKSHRLVHISKMNFMLHELYPNHPWQFVSRF